MVQVAEDRVHSARNAAIARRIVGQFVARYNEVRLQSAIGFVTPKDKLEGRDTEILAARDCKLEAACAERKVRRQTARREVLEGMPENPEHSPLTSRLE